MLHYGRGMRFVQFGQAYKTKAAKAKYPMYTKLC